MLRRNIGGSSKRKATAPLVSWRGNNMVTIMIHWKDKNVSDKAIWMLVGGVVAIIIGLVGLLRGSKGN